MQALKKYFILLVTLVACAVFVTAALKLLVYSPDLEIAAPELEGYFLYT